jgi:hypothetical protein
MDRNLRRARRRSNRVERGPALRRLRAIRPRGSFAAHMSEPPRRWRDTGAERNLLRAMSDKIIEIEPQFPRLMPDVARGGESCPRPILRSRDNVANDDQRKGRE